jgi:hypothetical protein
MTGLTNAQQAITAATGVGLVALGVLAPIADPNLRYVLVASGVALVGAKEALGSVAPAAAAPTNPIIGYATDGSPIYQDKPTK